MEVYLQLRTQSIVLSFVNSRPWLAGLWANESRFQKESRNQVVYNRRGRELHIFDGSEKSSGFGYRDLCCNARNWKKVFTPFYWFLHINSLFKSWIISFNSVIDVFEYEYLSTSNLCFDKYHDERINVSQYKFSLPSMPLLWSQKNTLLLIKSLPFWAELFYLI